jgi:hypothetical protein
VRTRHCAAVARACTDCALACGVLYARCALAQSASLFKMYGTYIVNYDEAMKRMRLLEQAPEFRAFVRACE